MRFKWIVFVVGLVALSSFAFYGLFDRSDEVSHIVAPVTKIDMESLVLATGPIVATGLVDVGAQVNGQVKTIHVRLGDKVKKGQVLVEIDPELQENALSKAKASRDLVLAQQKAKEKARQRAERVFTRQQALYQADASAKRDLEQAEVELENARAEVFVLKSQIHLAQIEMDSAVANLGYTKIKAPADGEIIAIVTKEGQTIVSAQTSPTILIMGNMDRMTVKARISESDIVRVQEGQKVVFTVTGAPELSFESKILAVELLPESVVTDSKELSKPNATSNVPVYYNATFEVDNPDRLLKPLMIANVKITQESVGQVMAIPLAALGKKQSAGNLYEVRILTEQKEVIARSIAIGLRNNTHVQVKSGLELGDNVIIE